MNTQALDFSSFFSVSPDAATSEAEMTGYARGLEDGRASAEAQAGRLLSSSLDRVESALIGVIETTEARLTALEAEASALAFSFARALSMALISDTQRIERAFAAVLADLVAHPAVTIRLNPALIDALGPALTERLARAGTATRLTLEPAPDIPPGDCNIIWAGGRVRLDRAALEQRLSDHIARAFPETAFASTGSAP